MDLCFLQCNEKDSKYILNEKKNTIIITSTEEGVLKNLLM